MVQLAGKRIIVTGSSSGMGRAVAALARAQGAEVIGVDRNDGPDPLDGFIRADLSGPPAATALAAALPANCDGLANIAGLPPTAPPGQVLAVNYKALVALTLALVPKLADGASIVNMASLAGSAWAGSLDQIDALDADPGDDMEAFARDHGIGVPRSYFLAKEAVVVWTMRNRWTWRDRGIRINAVSPGPVETPILPDFIATLGDRPSLRPGLMDRFGRPEDVAPVVTFLLSDAAAWIRGANIPVDGGMSAHMALSAHGHEKGAET